MENNILKNIEEILLKENKPSIELDRIIQRQDFKESDFNVIVKLKDIPQEKKYHPEGNVWNHTKMVVDIAALIKEFSEDIRSFMCASLLHDIGKIPTTKFIRGRYRSYDHDREGAEMAYNLIRRYGEDRLAEDVKILVRYHMHHIYISKNMKFADYKGLLESNKINDIVLLFIADKLGRGNQTYYDFKENIEEVLIILDKIECKSYMSYGNLKKKINDIKNILLKE
ncbi:HD domain-containing protein [Caproiciproducens sp. MSJ-32]|uniref:HD domain-containing protein n=1 Tax=Caproiciproducens sp. MSJ-32 TaxID=2841527 RepID=UPI001C11DFB0|nr:HD domain-containing protein [Caproiciproducens sp. MSJ-32]MBU5456171.1 HD domain-containing protein [Caproiciproducens sp. MSJ-32]